MREATPAERKTIMDREARMFGYTINPCQSIPPRHSPYLASDGITYCTRCGNVLGSSTADTKP
jgi:hypothetical protein